MTQQMTDRLIGVLLFVAASTIFFMTAAGITSSNDGSHYALLRALGDEGRYEIETYFDFTEHNDYAEYEGRRYSDRAPGTAILALPFYGLAQVLPGPAALPYLGHDAGNPDVITVLMLPAMAGGLTVALFYALLRSYALSRGAAVTASLALAFSTTLWKYSGVLLSHAVSALFILAGVMLALWITRKGRLSPGIALLEGLVLGYSVLVEFSNAIFIPIVLIYLLLSLKKALFMGDRWALSILLMGLGGFIPVAFLMHYNTINFGGPFTTSYSYIVVHEWARSFNTTFDFPLLKGLGIMWWGGQDTSVITVQGFLTLMPVLALAVIGWPFYIHKHRDDSLFVLAVFIAFMLLIARHRSLGGASGDVRYMLPALPLLAIGLGFALEKVFTLSPGGLQAASLFVVYALIFVSIRNMLLHIGYSPNYHLNLHLVHRQASLPEDWRYMAGNIFVNVPNVPLLWLAEAIILSAGYGLRRLFSHMPGRSPTGGVS